MSGDELRVCRWLLGARARPLSQTEMGRRVHRSLRQVQYYEAGEVPVPPLVAERVRDLVAARAGNGAQ